jgi:hypothetical protein
MFLANLAVTGIKAMIPIIIPINVVITGNHKITFEITNIATPIATVKP